MAVTTFTTFTEMLLEKAEKRPGTVGFGFLPDGEGAVTEITYGELTTEARRIATLLADRLAPGSRAVLVFPPGLEFIAAFFGCLLAGVIAVPAFPPAPPGIEAGVRRLRRIVADADADAEAVLTTAGYRAFRDTTPELAAVEVPWLVTDDPRLGDPGAWADRGVDAGTVAMIQYTSGSTADPKGVVLRHANLIANQRAIQQAMDLSDRAVAVSWLPMYHDMGLIGFVLQALYVGIPSYLMSPLHFLERPARWLRAISRFGATISGGPNFAFELCLKRVADEDKEGLDLSSWTIAFTGADHVRAETLRRFAQRFADCGLRPGALYPCYGLAEASLLVTGSVPLGGPRTARLDPGALAAGSARPMDPDAAPAVESVSSGRPPDDHEVVIVDPDAGRPLPEGRVGEVWVSGPSIAAGYWNRPEPTAATFHAVLPGRDETFLRTGDLGFLLDGELHVTGRAKDLIIVRGRNVYPQDVEIAAQEADRRARAGCGAAFGISVDGAEEVALLQEVSADEAELPEILRGLRRRSPRPTASAWPPSAWSRPGPGGTAGGAARRVRRRRRRSGLRGLRGMPRHRHRARRPAGGHRSRRGGRRRVRDAVPDRVGQEQHRPPGVRRRARRAAQGHAGRPSR